ncbi:hypothetical protein [Kineothrix sp. MB12-C1]|uniref:hypothetical protein n=1 Tax=Kineothrix sp. MB12-C1 TaxID=3070215 RepID=UPI0027D2BEA3|nr:hypothetical protein [Kineothrix sp. MB12-C1]WMC91239.1 hypothetical protein RBB56_10115 [Kineothrix sp. MB12-C1]
MDNYSLGILWGCGNFSENRMIIRHSEKYFLEKIQEIVGRTIYEQVGTSDRKQYVLKFRMEESELREMGWSPRNADERHIPVSADAEFLRAYLEMHSSVDWQTAYYGRNRSRKYKKVRLRVFGNIYLIDELNELISRVCGTTIKTPQRTVGKTTMYLSICNQEEIAQIYDMLCKHPCYEPYWEKYFNMMQEYARSKKIY